MGRKSDIPPLVEGLLRKLREHELIGEVNIHSFNSMVGGTQGFKINGYDSSRRTYLLHVYVSNWKAFIDVRIISDDKVEEAGDYIRSLRI